MPFFIVTVREVHTQMIKVDAQSSQEALAKVAAGQGEYIDGTLEYGHTLPPDTWTVEQTEGQGA